MPQAGILAQQLLEKRLNKHGYHQSTLVPGLWTHEWRPIQFTLVVDDFGVKYTGEEHAKHLMAVLNKDYTITHYWKGAKYVGITLDWDYSEQKVHLSMPGYIKEARQRFNHPMTEKRQDSPYPHTPPKYGAKIQYADEQDTAQLLDKEGKRYIQQVCGTFLYLARAVYTTCLTPLSAIASQQSKPTTETMDRAKQFLDYVSTQEEPILTYSASKMILATHSDAGYLNVTNAHS